MPMKMPAKVIKLSAVSEFFSNLQEEKEIVSILLAAMVPNCFPVDFRKYLAEIVLPKILTDGRYANYLLFKPLGFDSAEHLEEKIEILKEIWKGNIAVSFRKLKQRTSKKPMLYVMFDPVL
jgi:hypothetical protein